MNQLDDPKALYERYMPKEKNSTKTERKNTNQETVELYVQLLNSNTRKIVHKLKKNMIYKK